MVPIYVTDSGKSSGMSAHFDVAMLTVHVGDVNDHAPVFRAGSCYPLAVPENGEPSVIHTVIAKDEDSGQNGEIVYSITGKWLHHTGNILFTYIYRRCLKSSRTWQN